MRLHAHRLPPGCDLKDELQRLVRDCELRAGFIVTAVGSLSRARLRIPGEPGEEDQFRLWEEPMEILSLAGALSHEGLHLHLALSRRDGSCVGGHLVDGCVVRTTAELVIGEAEHLVFTRPVDPATGYRELVVRPRHP